MLRIDEIQAIVSKINDCVRELKHDIYKWEDNYTVIEGDDTKDYTSKCIEYINNISNNVMDIPYIAEYILDIEARKEKYEVE